MQLDDMDQVNAPHMACERIGQKPKNFLVLEVFVGHHYVDVRTQGPSDKTSSSSLTLKKGANQRVANQPRPTNLDLKGYKCPYQLKARKAMYGAPAGQQFLVGPTQKRQLTSLNFAR